MPPLSPFSKSCLAVAIAQAFSMQTTQAATITVDNLVDNGIGCTLRDAISNTNAGSNQSNDCIISGSLGTNDTINFNPGFADSTIMLNSRQLDITDDVVINGLNITIDANTNSKVMYINASTVTLNDLTITNGSASNGGGIYAYNSTVSLSNGSVSGNSASNYAGGILADNSNFYLNNITLSDNSSGYKAGGIRALTSNINFSNSTISSNSAFSTGGGIYVTSTSSVSITNSTISGNTASTGGGIYARTANNSSINLINSTVSGNVATSSYGGGIMNQATNNLSLINSIVAGNSASVSSEIHNNGTITANHQNLFGHSGLTDAQAFDSFAPGVNDIKATSDGTSISLSNIINPLADNGGDTLTHALFVGSPLVVGSPAIDASGAGATATDQRGFSAIGTRDIGAFESGSVVGLDITVDSNLDDNGSNCTLREAIATTNVLSNLSNGCFNIGTPGDPSTINFDSSLSDSTISLSNGQLKITQDVVINGLNNTIDAGLASRVLYMRDSTISLDQLILTKGFQPAGGGIYARSSSVNLSNSTVTDNSAIKGAGIYTKNLSSISVNNSTISNNSASTKGGAVDIYNSIVSINKSTISENSANSYGGGIYLHSSSIDINNSTVSGNSTTYGGGIYALVSSVVELNNSTVTNNSASSRGGGVYVYTGSTTLNNSIVSGNFSDITAEVRTHISTVAVNNNNLFGHSGLTNAQAFYSFTPGANDINATSDGGDLPTAITAILNTTLADNGGGTFTHELVAGSPAINAGDDSICTASPINNLDQRGEIRPAGTHCDIGSFEFIDDNGFIVIPLPGNKAVVIPSG